jgi:hypothetical protein
LNYEPKDEEEDMLEDEDEEAEGDNGSRNSE